MSGKYLVEVWGDCTAPNAGDKLSLWISRVFINLPQVCVLHWAVVPRNPCQRAAMDGLVAVLVGPLLGFMLPLGILGIVVSSLGSWHRSWGTRLYSKAVACT